MRKSSMTAICLLQNGSWAVKPMSAITASTDICPIVLSKMHLYGCPQKSIKRSSLGHIKKPPVDATAWCYTGTREDTNFSFAWTIENFGRKMEIYKNGECLTSDTFKV